MLLDVAHLTHEDTHARIEIKKNNSEPGKLTRGPCVAYGFNGTRREDDNVLDTVLKMANVWTRVSTFPV